MKLPSAHGIKKNPKQLCKKLKILKTVGISQKGNERCIKTVPLL